MTASVESGPWLNHYPPDVSATIQYREGPLFSLLEEAAASHPDLPALRFASVRLSYKELWAQAERFAAALTELGINKGDRVALTT